MKQKPSLMRSFLRLILGDPLLCVALIKNSHHKQGAFLPNEREINKIRANCQKAFGPASPRVGGHDRDDPREYSCHTRHFLAEPWAGHARVNPVQSYVLIVAVAIEHWKGSQFQMGSFRCEVILESLNFLARKGVGFLNLTRSDLIVSRSLQKA